MRQTRKYKADQLWRLLVNGPFLSAVPAIHAREAHTEIKRWLGAWIQPLVKELVPELRAPAVDPSTIPARKRA